MSWKQIEKNPVCYDNVIKTDWKDWNYRPIRLVTYAKNSLYPETLEIQQTLVTFLQKKNFILVKLNKSKSVSTYSINCWFQTLTRDHSEETQDLKMQSLPSRHLMLNESNKHINNELRYKIKFIKSKIRVQLIGSVRTRWFRVFTDLSDQQ